MLLGPVLGIGRTCCLRYCRHSLAAVGRSEQEGTLLTYGDVTTEQGSQVSTFDSCFPSSVQAVLVWGLFRPETGTGVCFCRTCEVSVSPFFQTKSLLMAVLASWVLTLLPNYSHCGFAENVLFSCHTNYV